MEEDAFWLLACLLEDVLDPDFFGADAPGPSLVKVRRVLTKASVS